MEPNTAKSISDGMSWLLFGQVGKRSMEQTDTNRDAGFIKMQSQDVG